MKWIITLTFLLLGLDINSNINNPKGNKVINTLIATTEYQKNYNEVLEFLKLNEGFRANWYDDLGYKTIGYGQRQAFYRGKITSPISREQAERILKISFNNHLRMIKKVYPQFEGNKLLSLAHISYTIGIGRIKTAKLLINNQLNTNRLLSIGAKRCRQFEIDLFNK